MREVFSLEVKVRQQDDKLDNTPLRNRGYKTVLAWFFYCLGHQKRVG